MIIKYWIVKVLNIVRIQKEKSGGKAGGSL